MIECHLCHRVITAEDKYVLVCCGIVQCVAHRTEKQNDRLLDDAKGYVDAPVRVKGTGV